MEARWVVDWRRVHGGATETHKIVTQGLVRNIGAKGSLVVVISFVAHSVVVGDHGRGG